MVKASETILVAEQREAKGTTGSRRIRRAGFLPAIIYNEKGESELIQLDRPVDKSHGCTFT
jgi:ribosomal protein L25 (general stress protein Ctc)